MATASSQLLAFVMEARATGNDTIKAANASLGQRTYEGAQPLVKQAASLYNLAVVEINKAQGVFNSTRWSASESAYSAQIIDNALKLLGRARGQLEHAQAHLQSLPRPHLPVQDRSHYSRKGVQMDPQKMFSRVAPMLTQRGLGAFMGASPGVQATLLSGVDVGVVRANIEGLAGFAEANGLTLDGMVEIGRAPNPGLGSYSSAADTAQLARNNALNANSESAAAKKATTRAAATPHLNNAHQFIQTAIRLNDKAMNDFNGTDPSTDSTGVDTGVASGAISSASTAIAAAQANYNSAGDYAQKLPAPGGGGGGGGTTKTCPTGQHLDASGNCIPDAVSPAAATKSTNWWLIGAGVLAAGVIAVVVTQPSEEEKKAKQRKLKAA